MPTIGNMSVDRMLHKTIAKTLQNFISLSNKSPMSEYSFNLFG